MTEYTDADLYAPLVNNSTLTSGVGVITVPRTSVAAIIDSDTGLLTTAAANQLRFDSQHGALFDSQDRTNTALWCRDYTKAAWVPSATGPQLAINGTFDTDTTGWVVPGGTNTIAAVSGNLELTIGTSGDGGSFNNVAAIPTVIGKTYIASFTYVSKTVTGNTFFKLATTFNGSQYLEDVTNTTSKTYNYKIVATSTELFIRIGGSNLATSGQKIVVDNISVKLADVQATLDQPGIDGVANSASRLTAEVDNAMILQTITEASSAGCSSVSVKRLSGSGAVYFTRDGGSTLTDITGLISGTYARVKIDNTSVANPQVGFKFSTSGDSIAADYTNNELGTASSMPILTTSAAVTRKADLPTAQTSGNFSDTAGTIVATVTRDDWSANNGVVVGNATNGLGTSNANSGAQALDGTNTVNGPSGSPPTKTRKIGMRWSGSSMQVMAGGKIGSSGSYDGSFNLSSIGIGSGASCYIKDLAIFLTALSDNDWVSVVATKSSITALSAADASFVDNYFIGASMTSDAVSSASFVDNYIIGASIVSDANGSALFVNNYIISSDFVASGSADASFSNNYIMSASFDAESIATALFVVQGKSLLSSKEISLTYHRPTIILSI